MMIPDADEFYGELIKSGGCLSLACLHPSSWSRTYCEDVWKRWSACGNDGLFAYLDQRREMLLAPFQSRPWAKCLLVFSFLPEVDPEHRLKKLPPALPGRLPGWIAGYAVERDYHLTGKRIAAAIQAFLQDRFGAEIQFEWGVDASPVLEKQAAVMAGIGRQGWNGLLYDEKFGPQIHLGTAFCQVELPERILPAGRKSCPRCGRCVKNCPGGALLGDGQISVERCLSWLSGEKHGPLSWQEQLRLQNHVFGCSVCTTSCPGISRVLLPDYAVDAEAVLLMSGRQLEKMIYGTALQHMGAARFKRNCAAVLGSGLSAEERAGWQDQHLKEIASPMVRETILNWPRN